MLWLCLSVRITLHYIALHSITLHVTFCVIILGPSWAQADWYWWIVNSRHSGLGLAPPQTGINSAIESDNTQPIIWSIYRIGRCLPPWHEESSWSSDKSCCRILTVWRLKLPNEARVCWYHDWYGHSASTIIGLHPSFPGAEDTNTTEKYIHLIILDAYSYSIHDFQMDPYLQFCWCTTRCWLICRSWILIQWRSLQSLTLRHAKYRSHHRSNYCHLHQDDLCQDSLQATPCADRVSSSCLRSICNKLIFADTTFSEKEIHDNMICTGEASLSSSGFFSAFHFKCVVLMSNYLDTSIYLFSQIDRRTDIETKDLWSF